MKKAQKTLEQSRTVLDQIKKKVKDGQPVTSELMLLSTLEDEIKPRGVKALRRHQVS